MTRKEAKKLLPIIKAYSDGKQVQYFNGKYWEDGSELLNFNDDPCCYRIKKQSKYRPFKNIEECLNEMSEHQPFGWYKNKNNNNDYSLVTHLDKNTDFKYRFKNYLFADGTPFGIKEEE